MLLYPYPYSCHVAISIYRSFYKCMSMSIRLLLISICENENFLFNSNLVQRFGSFIVEFENFYPIHNCNPLPNSTAIIERKMPEIQEKHRIKPTEIIYLRSPWIKTVQFVSYKLNFIFNSSKEARTTTADRTAWLLTTNINLYDYCELKRSTISRV